MTIGNRIRSLRKELNYSQEYIAEQLNVSRQAVSKWEKDISKPDTNNIIQLANLLNSTVEYIASGKKEISEVVCNNNKEKNKLSKKQKKIIIISISIISVLIGFLSLIIYIHTRPVEWDSAACGGGYITWIFDKYKDELTQTFLNGMGEEKENIISIEAIRGTQNAEWENRQIFLDFEVKYEHKEYGAIEEKIRFIGNRYWIDSFKWSGAIIIGE